MLQLELSPKPPSPVSGMAKNFVPTYNGEENAFSIQLFCIDERYEMRYVKRTVAGCSKLTTSLVNVSLNFQT